MTLVAITGGTGFVGATAVSHFSAHGSLDVRLLLRATKPDLTVGEIMVGDLQDPSTCDRLVDGADVVVHLAGLVRSRDIAALQRVNVDGTLSLLRAAARAGVRRFVHVSSTGVYGRPGVCVDEASPRRPANPYERSKAEAERALLHEATSVEVVIVQPSNVVGVGSPIRPLRRFLARARAGRLVIHTGAWTNYVDVDDVARVLVAAATRDAVPSTLIVNVPMPLGAFVMLAGDAVDRPGRSIELPRFVGRVLAPVAGAASSRVPSLERALALADQTRFETSHQAWYDEVGLHPGLGVALGEMAAAYGLAPRR